MFRGEKGITLVALVITIIVLIILAAVSISAVTTFNIPGNAQTAANNYRDNAIVENSTLEDYNSTISNYITANPAQ